MNGCLAERWTKKQVHRMRFVAPNTQLLYELQHLARHCAQDRTIARRQNTHSAQHDRQTHDHVPRQKAAGSTASRLQPMP